MTTDYAHTRTARENREKKAQALAAAAHALGLAPDALSVGGGGRRSVWKAAELTHSPSEETWHLAAQVMRETLPPVVAGAPRRRGPQSQPCRYGDGRPARLYLGGWLCTEHAPTPPPAPRPGTTLDEMRAARGIRQGAHQLPATTVIDDRAIASGKRRSSPNVYRAARAAEEQRKGRAS